MKCPKCGDPTLKYMKSRRKNWKGRLGDSNRGTSMELRTNFKARCSRCNWEGEIH